MAVSLIKQSHYLPGLTNYNNVPIPGTDVQAFFGVRESDPSLWIYSLWTGDDESLLSFGSLDMSGLDVTPEQVARVAFLLDIEYGE